MRNVCVQFGKSLKFVDDPMAQAGMEIRFSFFHVQGIRSDILQNLLIFDNFVKFR